MAEVQELDGWLLATRESAEVRAQQRQMGRSLLRLLADLGWPLSVGAPSKSAQADAHLQNETDSLAWPAAWAWAGVCLDLAQADLVQAYLYSWVANQISAASQIAAKKMSVREAESLVKKLGAEFSLKAVKPAREKSRDIKRVEEELSDLFAAQVEIKVKKRVKRSGRITEMGELSIQFGSLDELNGLIERLSPNVAR